MGCLSSPRADLLSSHRPHLSSRSAASRANHHRAVKHKSSTPPPPLPRCRSIPFPRFVPMAAAASPQFVSLPCPRCCRTRRVYLCRRRRVYLCRRPAEGAAAARLQCSPAKAVAAEAAAVEMGNRIGTVGLPRPDAMGRFRRFGSKYVPESLTTLATEFHVMLIYTCSRIYSLLFLSHCRFGHRCSVGFLLVHDSEMQRQNGIC
jgi:hypothetical protein